MDYLDQVSYNDSTYLGLCGAWAKIHVFHVPRVTSEFFTGSLIPWTNDLNERYPMQAYWVLSDKEKTEAIEEPVPGVDYDAFFLVEIPRDDYPMFDLTIRECPKVLGANSSDVPEFIKTAAVKFGHSPSDEEAAACWPFRTTEGLGPEQAWPHTKQHNPPLKMLRTRVEFLAEKNK
jgi:hypothetical protein